MVLTKRTCNLPLICQICGDTARGINFDVMTCMSCKAFFRRHALQPANHLQCQLSNDCEITQITRGGCSACRLKKCLSLGMNSSLIRYIPRKRRPTEKKINCLLPLPKPLNLLQNDNSTLTTFEWNLLSNILFSYDQGNFIEHSKFLLDQQAILPPKLRAKQNSTLHIVEFFYSAFQTFVERVPYYRELPLQTHRLLTERNSNITGAYNAVYLVKKTNAMDYPAYIIGSTQIYGPGNTDVLYKFISEIEQNTVVYKIMLLLLGFSENCSIIDVNHSMNSSFTLDYQLLLKIQDTIVTMLWKYLTYQYGFSQAIKCFSSFIYYVLKLLGWMKQGAGERHAEMVGSIIVNVDRSLMITD